MKKNPKQSIESRDGDNGEKAPRTQEDAVNSDTEAEVLEREPGS